MSIVRDVDSFVLTLIPLHPNLGSRCEFSSPVRTPPFTDGGRGRRETTLVLLCGDPDTTPKSSRHLHLERVTDRQSYSI